MALAIHRSGHFTVSNSCGQITYQQQWWPPENGRLQDGFDHSFDEEREESEHAGEAPHREPASFQHETGVQDGQDDDAYAQHDDDAFARAHG